MFPWFPFFVYPDRRHRRSDEDRLEVAVEQTGTPCPANSRLRIVCRYSSTSSSSLLPKAPTQNVHVEFHAKEHSNGANAASDREQDSVGDELRRNGGEEPVFAFAKSEDRCSTNASTSSANVSSKGTARQSAKSGSSTSLARKQSPKPSSRSDGSAASSKSPLLVRATPPQRRRRSAFETSQAMRELFGGSGTESPIATEKRRDSLGGEQTQIGGSKDNTVGDLSFAPPVQETSAGERHLTDQEEENHTRAKPIATTPSSNGLVNVAKGMHEIPPTLAQEPGGVDEQNGNGSTREQGRPRDGGGGEQDGDIIATDGHWGTKEGVGQQPQPALSPVQHKNRQRNVARVAPFAYFPPAEEEQRAAVPFQQQPGRTQFADGDFVQTVKEEKEKEDDIKHNLEGGKARTNGANWRPNGISAQQQIVGKRPTEELSCVRTLPGDQPPGKVKTTATGREQQQQQDKGRETTGSSGTNGSSGGGGGSAPIGPSPEMVVPNETTMNGTKIGGGVEGQLLIKGALVVNDDDMYAANVLIRDGIIVQISRQTIESADQVEQIDGAGRFLLPAGIDVQTAIGAGNGGGEALKQATRAALSGGTGTIIDTFVSDASGDALLTAMEHIVAQINTSAECNVGLSIAIEKWCSGGQTSADMAQIVNKAGVNSFLFNLAGDVELNEAMDRARSLGALSRVYSNSGDMIALLEQKLRRQGIQESDVQVTEKFETRRVHQLSAISELTNAPVSVLSLNSCSASRALRECGRSGCALVSAELPLAVIAGLEPSICPTGRIPRNDSADAVLEVLINHPLCACVSDQQRVDAGSSVSSSIRSPPSFLLEQRMSLLWEKAVLAGKMDPMRFVAATSANAARLFNLYPRKGRVAIGSDADLVLWDIQNSLHANTVILSGKVRVRAGKFEPLSSPILKHENESAQRKMQRFLHLLPNSPHLFTIVKFREKNFNFADYAHRDQRELLASSTLSYESSSFERKDSRQHQNEEQMGIAVRPGSTNRNAQSDQPPSRATTKVIQPPGGKSTAFW